MKTGEWDAPNARGQAGAGAEDASENACKMDIEAIRQSHEAIIRRLGLQKPLQQRGECVSMERKVGMRAYVVICLAIVALVVIIGVYMGFYRYVDWRESELALAQHAAELEKEQARRDRIEYADIAFLESLPPLVAITMEGKSLYAKTKEGAYTELRARESTWIRNLPIKEDTVLHFGFSAEGFKPLTRSVAYYDWFPSRSPSGNPLQKAYKRIVLEPDNTPRVADCARLEKIGGSDPCEWSVFREIAFRERYGALLKSLVLDESQKNLRMKENFVLHPSMFSEVGLTQEAVLTGKIPADATDSAKALYRNVMENPYGMYGRLTIETDTPNTRVFFMGEPLMALKPSGSYAQVQISPDSPYVFSVYGMGKPLEIGQEMSLRLEAPNMPPYTAEITPLQWHCEVPGIETLLTLSAPPVPESMMTPDYRHYMCDYRLTVSVRFEAIRANERELESRSSATQDGQN